MTNTVGNYLFSAIANLVCIPDMMILSKPTVCLIPNTSMKPQVSPYSNYMVSLDRFQGSVWDGTHNRLVQNGANLLVVIIQSIISGIQTRSAMAEKR